MSRSPNADVNRSSSYPDLATPSGTNIMANINLRKRRNPDLDSLDEIKSMIKEMNDQYVKRNEDLVNTVKQVNAKLLESQEELKQIIVANQLQFIELKQKVDVLSVEHAAALGKINILESQLEDVLRTQNKCKLELRNVPKIPNEDLNVIVSTLHETLAIQNNELKIGEIYRRGRRDNAPIIIEYKDLSATKTVLEKVKTFNRAGNLGKLKAKHLGFSEILTPVYVSEVLTAKARATFNAARELQKEGWCKFVWTSKGKVLVRKEIGQPSLVISSQDQLIVLNDQAKA